MVTTTSSISTPSYRRRSSSTNSSKFSDNALSTLESLVLACALEDARVRARTASRCSGSAASFSSSSTCISPSSTTCCLEQVHDDDGDDVLYEMNPVDYEKLQQLPGNDACADCGSNDTEWGSVTYGILICTLCSGHHRAFGTHVSRVRSVKMDSWSEDQMKRMQWGGNHQWNSFLMETCCSLQDKYTSPGATRYRQILDARVQQLQENGPPPTTESLPQPELCRSTTASTASTITSSMMMQDDSGCSGQSYSTSQMMQDDSSYNSQCRYSRRYSSSITNTNNPLHQQTPSPSATTIAASSPTITYMGRSFLAASVPPATSTTITSSMARSSPTMTPPSPPRYSGKLNSLHPSHHHHLLVVDAGISVLPRQDHASYQLVQQQPQLLVADASSGDDKNHHETTAAEGGVIDKSPLITTTKQQQRRRRPRQKQRSSSTIQQSLSSSSSLLFQQLAYNPTDVWEIASDDCEFARLKRTLQHNGAVTNEVIKQRMFAFVANRKRRQEKQQLRLQQQQQQEYHEQEEEPKE